MVKRVSFPLLLALVFSTLGFLTPATAAVPKTTISLSAPATVEAGLPAKFTGRVSGKSVRATVVLQQKRGTSWATVKKARVTSAKRYGFVLYLSTPARELFRVKVLKTKKLRPATSRTVAVTVRAPETEEPPANELAQVQALILQQTNDFRASQGLEPLLPMAELNTVATNWATYMATSGDFSHNPHYFSQYPQENLWGGGENIAYGYGKNEVVKGWINSPGHRANMLSNYTHLGVGYAVDANGRPYYVQNFATYGE